MSTMITEVYDAFKAANVPEDKAKAAAQAIANYEHQFSEIKNQFSEIKGELLLLKWMVGFSIALNVSIVLKTFF